MAILRRKSSKLVIFLVVLVDLLGFGIMIPMLPFYARSFEASASEVGALMFAYSFMQLLVAPLWGNMSDRWGRRPILLLTILGQSLAFLWGSQADSYFSLLLSRVLAGLFAANISTANAYMADITKPEERAKGMGLIGAAFGLGFVFGPAIGGVLIEWNPSYPSLVAACIAAANFVFAYFVLAEPINREEFRKQNRRRVSLKDFREILDKPNLLIPIILFFLLTMAFVQLEVPFGFFVLDRFHLSQRQAGYLLALLGIVMAMVQGGLIGRLTKIFAEVRLVLTGMFFIVLGLATMVFAQSFGFFITGLVSLALGYSLTNPCLSALLSKSVGGDKQGSALGLYQSGGSLARILAPILAGSLYDKRIDYPFISGIFFVIIAGVTLISRLFINKNSTRI